MKKNQNNYFASEPTENVIYYFTPMAANIKTLKHYNDNYKTIKTVKHIIKTIKTACVTEEFCAVKKITLSADAFLLLARNEISDN